MIKKYKVKTKAVIDRNPVGSTIELPKADADRLSNINYVDIIGEVKPTPKKAPAKKASAPTKPKAKAKPKTADKTTK